MYIEFGKTTERPDMKIILPNPVAGLLLAIMMALSSGCRTGLTTSLVWRIKSYHPAEMPNVCLASSEAKNDLLVQYDECFADSKEVRPRAYWLLEYADSIKNPDDPPKPQFVNTADCGTLLPVPMVVSGHNVSTSGFCVVRGPDQSKFALWRDGISMGTYSLPVYSNAPPVTVKRVALTPVTVAADGCIIVAASFWWVYFSH
jgi:hypothetical protein